MLCITYLVINYKKSWYSQVYYVVMSVFTFLPEQYPTSFETISYSDQSGCFSFTIRSIFAFAPNRATRVASLAVPCVIKQ